MQTKKSG